MQIQDSGNLSLQDSDGGAILDSRNAAIKRQSLIPLRHSFTVDGIENELRNLVTDLFDAYLYDDAFDANVLGMAHLGSLNLVKRMVNVDGLSLLPGDREEESTRYIYRAWKAKNMQGRGLFFLKTYLQLLYPGYWSVEQQMQDKASPYPTALSDRSRHGNDANKFLTSRVHIKLNAAGNIGDVSGIIPVISTILPARFVPKIFLLLHTKAKLRIGGVFSVALSLRGSGHALMPPHTLHGDVVVAAHGNAAITLMGGGYAAEPAMQIHDSGNAAIRDSLGRAVLDSTPD